MPVNGHFVQDVTIPDNTPINAGATFTKTWLVQNTGDVPWGAGFSFVHVNGEQMAAVNKVPLPAAAPGQQVQVSLQMTAPAKLGRQFSDWRFQDDKGKLFGVDIPCVIIQVKEAPRNDCYFVADVTVPDGTKMQPGATFTKTWRIKNSGNTTWGPGYEIVYVDGTPMNEVSKAVVPVTAPNATADISVNLKAPLDPGSYNEDFKLRDATGQLFGAKLWFQIAVVNPAAAPTPSVPAPAPIGQPAVAPAPSVAPVTPAPAPVVRPVLQATAPHLSQRDPRWSNIPLANMGGAPSIGRWGCMMTCLTMTANTYGHAVTPDQFNLLMVERGAFVNGYFTSWSALNTVFNDIAFDGKMDMGSDIVGRVDQFLQAGRPVPVTVDNTPATAYSDVDQHWVLVVGRNGDDYWVNDPMDLDGNPRSIMGRYGRPGGTLRDAVRAALFYRK